jgi:hypothetical protein
VAAFHEDWSVLRGKDLSTTGDFWDRVKFIPPSPDGSVYFSLGGQARERVEYFNEFLFGDSKGRSAFATDSDLTGGATNAFESKFTLLNAFGDVKIPFGDKDNLTVRGGRFEMIYGFGVRFSSELGQFPDPNDTACVRPARCTRTANLRGSLPLSLPPVVEPVFESRPRFRSHVYEVTRCLVPNNATRLKHAVRCSLKLSRYKSRARSKLASSRPWNPCLHVPRAFKERLRTPAVVRGFMPDVRT